MKDRLLLDKINFENGTVKIDGREYKLLDSKFPTIDSRAESRRRFSQSRRRRIDFFEYLCLRKI